jgi:inhibitor of cysteine peptidase
MIANGYGSEKEDPVNDKLVRYVVVMSVFLGMVLFAGCGTGQTHLTGSDNGATLQISPGDTVAIALDSNPTTGYSWQIIQMDDSLLQLMREPEFQADNEENQLVGAPGTETFTLQALATGQATLILGYSRPWEETVPPVEMYTIHFLIE